MPAPQLRLADKVAVVVGTSPNIGGGIAEALAEAGAAIVCLDFDERNAADCARAIEALGGRAFGRRCDARNEAEVAEVVADAVRTFGRIDVLVNGAAYYNMKGILDMPLAEFRDQVDLILSSVFVCTKHVAGAMIAAERGGSIMHLASTEAHQGNPKNVAYCTAKAGLLNMARANAMELVAHKIRVNTLTPTATDPTESSARAVRWGRPPLDLSEHLVFKRMRLLPGGQAPSPSDYGAAAVFLASDESKMITGFDLRVDTGAIARYWGWGEGTL